jgi:1,4-alpha-glucan branching enzyme
VRFALFEPHARHVSVSGEFNGWSADATNLSRIDGGLWETKLALQPGRYEYKFVVDGQWVPDPSVHENVYNAHGTLNSVVEVRA